MNLVKPFACPRIAPRGSISHNPRIIRPQKFLRQICR
jgi:hypothetical protein